ncbi:MAG: D-alanyl-D-alanine carboxypeptidase [Phenylobacterium sp.]
MLKHARRLFVSLGLAAATMVVVAPPAAQAQIPYFRNILSAKEGRYAAIVVDAKTGEVLYDRSPDAPRYPASITKVMTLYLTFEALSQGKLSLSDTLTISPHAASMAPTKLGLHPGETISVDDAIRAIAVKSANDMAVALAERIGGSEPRFATLMTLRAQELGMTNTRFVNASGLPDSRQLTSARDIALLSRSVMRDFPQYYSYFGQRQFTFRGETMGNHNHLLDSMPGVDGLKTGYTNASGFNLAASAVQNGRRLIAVVLGGSSVAARDNNVEDLLYTGFEVLRRRDRGEQITVAQNLFEPEPTGPVMRPPTEQGDADQRGLRIIVTDADGPGAMRPIADDTSEEDEPRLQPAVRVTPVKACHNVKITRVVRGRHGRRVKETRTEKRCSIAGERPRAEEAADTGTCKVIKRRGRHGKVIKERRCESDRPAKLTKASARREKAGDWVVQIGAFHSRSDAHAELKKVARKYSGHFADAGVSVGSASRGLYRARFTGLTQSEAREACHALKAHGQTCMATEG